MMKCKEMMKCKVRKYIGIEEFCKLGFLQEVNRKFFHPLGLALEVSIDNRTGEEYISGIWDYRDEPGGVVFSPCVNKEEETEFLEKIKNVEELRTSNAEERIKQFGDVIQPPPGE